jgi:hypothetical protein
MADIGIDCHWPVTVVQPPLLLDADILPSSIKDESVLDTQQLR